MNYLGGCIYFSDKTNSFYCCKCGNLLKDFTDDEYIVCKKCGNKQRR